MALNNLLKKNFSVSILKFSDSTRDFKFMRDAGNLNEILSKNYSKVYFIKNFPGLVDQPINERTFFIRPNSISRVSDSISVINALKNDLEVSQIFGVYSY